MPSAAKKVELTLTENSPISDQDNGVCNEDSNIDQEAEDSLWENLFVAEDDQSVVVRLRRLSPIGSINDPVTGQPVPLNGYLENLPPGEPSYDEYIANKYGGGRYTAQQRIGSRFGKLVKITISGRPPRLAPVDSPSPPPAEESGATDVEVDGIPLSGTDVQFEKRIERMLMIKNMLAQSPLEGKLLDLLLDRPAPQQPNLTDMVSQIAGVVTAVKEMLPAAAEGSGVGAGWGDIAVKGLDTVNRMIDKAGKIPAARPGVIASIENKNVPEQLPGPEQSEESSRMGMKDMAANAVANVIAGFRLSPSKEPIRVVRVLDAVLSLKPEELQQIAAYKDFLFDLAEQQLTDDFTDEPELREQFAKYFNEVFAEFVREGRSPFSMEG